MNSIGEYDENNLIGIRIIKEINKDNPYWYRIGIGCNSIDSLVESNNTKVVISPIRLHTMQVLNDANLRRFEAALETSDIFYICPSVIKDRGTKPKIYFEKKIRKNKESLKIVRACEVYEDDYLMEGSIAPFDNPIIPSNKQGCDIERIIKRKKGKAKMLDA